jgi:hypothetical protein
MLIEYKIKFEKDGLTITQRVEPSASVTPPVQPSAVGDLTVAKHLPSAFSAGKGGDGGPEIGPGGGGPESSPVTILGPIIFGASNGSSSPLAGKGGDGGPEIGPGGGPAAGAGGGKK